MSSLSTTTANAVRVRDLLPLDWEEVVRIYEDGIATGVATFETEPPSWERWDAAHPAIRVVRMSDDALVEGLQRKRIDGVEVPIFRSSTPRELSLTASSSATRSASTWHSKHFATAGGNAGSRWTSSGTTPRAIAWPM